jgi:hypothetical protein
MKMKIAIKGYTDKVFIMVIKLGEILRNIGIQKRLIGAFLLISMIPLVITGFSS